uniref:Putative serine protease K12H4.7 n=1 Tax=Phallusia mammillata TaxID=59560 RepID=A0A6F9DP30_9ASCI|nr:putative serine protease K12H4.7 [Phallusia mammillata]
MKVLVLVVLVTCLAWDSGYCLSQLRLRRFKLEMEEMRKQDPTSDLWIEQRLDNFHSTDYRTWQQRYFMANEYDSPSGPVFLQIGGEGPANPIWMSEGHWIEMAQTVNALCFMIEHRFYGKSHPTEDVSSSNLSYLSSEQALADIANFIVNIKEKHNLGNRKWIVFGGSYSGALAIWARLKYPHLVFGAESASAPLHALVDFTGYLEVAQDSLTTMGSGTCADNLSRASALVASHLKSDAGRKVLASSFRLCKALSDDGSDDSYLQESLAGNVMDVVQYNRDNRHFEGGGKSLTIKDVCRIMDDVTIGDEMKRYAELNSRTLDMSGSPCLDASYEKYLEDMSNTSWTSAIGGRQWVYQTCSEFGWYQTSDSPHQPFVGFGLKHALHQCQVAYGISQEHVQEAVKRSNENYGGRSVAEVVSRVTLYNGGIDPWSNVSYVVRDLQSPREQQIRFGPILSMQKKVNRKEPPGILTFFVPDTAHCAIMYPSSQNDSLFLKEARKDVQTALLSWLA